MALQVHSLGYRAHIPTHFVLTGESVRGKPGLVISGIPQTTSRSLSQTIITAIRASGIRLRARKVSISIQPIRDSVVSLSSLGLPIASLLLALNDTIPPFEPDRAVLGEVELDGTLTPPEPISSYLTAAQALGRRRLLIPTTIVDTKYQYILTGSTVHCVASLRQLCASERTKTYQLPSLKPHPTTTQPPKTSFEHIRGLWQSKRALTIALAGGHHTLLVGPPGVGKTMLATATQSLLPPLVPRDEVELRTLHALTNTMIPTTEPPKTFRVTPSRSTLVQLAGGGKTCKPGEIHFAHNGILFLDELTEFSQQCLLALRQPMESGVTQLLDQQNSQPIHYPASATIIATANPCACSRSSKPGRQPLCTCPPHHQNLYRKKLGAALLDRFALQCYLSPPPISELSTRDALNLSTKELSAQIATAHAKQRERYHSLPWDTNGRASLTFLLEHSLTVPKSKQFFLQVTKKLLQSARWHRHLLAIARTIADLADEPEVLPEHLAEALQYRPAIE